MTDITCQFCGEKDTLGTTDVNAFRLTLDKGISKTVFRGGRWLICYRCAQELLEDFNQREEEE